MPVFGIIGCENDPKDDTGLLKVNNAQVYKAIYPTCGVPIQFEKTNETIAGLNYILYRVFENTSDDAPIKSLADLIDGEQTVTLTNGKLNVSVGTPKSTALMNIDSLKTLYPDIAISTNNAKIFVVNGFINNIDFYNGDFFEQRADNGFIRYWYSDKAVNISGSVDQLEADGNIDYTIVFAMNLKVGWNTVLEGFFGDGTKWQYKTGKPPADAKWTY